MEETEMKKLFIKPEIDVIFFNDEENMADTNFIYTSSGGIEQN